VFISSARVLLREEEGRTRTLGELPNEYVQEVFFIIQDKYREIADKIISGYFVLRNSIAFINLIFQ
jgi:hypothetical protein